MVRTARCFFETFRQRWVTVTTTGNFFHRNYVPHGRGSSLNTGMDTAKQTIFPKEEYILNDINSENHFETNVWNIDDRYYSSKWHITDHYTSVIILKDIEDFESIPFCNEDPECKRMANVLFNMSLGMDFDISTAKSLFNTYKKELNLLEEQIQALKESNLLLLYCVLMDIVENNYSGMENLKVDYDGNLVK